MWSKVRNISVDISAVMSSEHSDWVIIVVVVCFEFLTVIWLLYCLRKLTSDHSCAAVEISRLDDMFQLFSVPQASTEAD